MLHLFSLRQSKHKGKYTTYMIKFNKNEYLIFATIIICAICYHVDNLGYTYGSTWQRLTYSFAHAGLLHLSINMLSFLSLSLPLRHSPYIALSMLCAVLATFGTEMYVPTVGLSGVCYALLGVHTVLSGRWIRIGLSAAAYNFIIWAVSDSVNVWVHCAAYAYGAVIALIAEMGMKVYKNIKINTYGNRR